MRPYFAVIPLLLIVSFALATVSPGSDADIETFDDGCLVYNILNENEVMVDMYKSESQIRDVTIPEEVTHDGTTYTVTSIAIGVFIDENITSVYIPKTVVELYAECFMGAGIERLDVDPDNKMFRSENGIIYDKKMMELVRCPANIQGGCVETPDSIAAIGRSAFDSGNVETVKLNNGLLLIDTFAFYGCESLTKIYVDEDVNELPDSVSFINSYAFSRCISLESLHLSNKTTFIGEAAFDESGLTGITIPLSVDYIGERAFARCTALKAIESDSIDYLCSDGVLFHKTDLLRLMCYPAGKEDESYIIPEEVTSISEEAFAGCVHLKRIDTNYMMSIPSMAFAHCTSLEEVNLRYATVIGQMAFMACKNLKTIQFGSELYVIYASAFESCGLEEFTVPDTVMLIDSMVFAYCEGLKRVVFPEDSDCIVSDFVFYCDTALEEIYVGSDTVQFEDESLVVGTYVSYDPFYLNMTVPKGYTLPAEVTNENTVIAISYIGEKPYPWENLIGVFFCVLVLIVIFRVFRSV